MEAAGFRPGEIAKILKLSPSRVSVILSDPRAEEERKAVARRVIEEVGDLYAKLLHHSNEAFEEILDELRNCEDPRIRQKAAFGILDRAGFAPIRKEIRRNINEGVGPELIARLEGLVGELTEVEASYSIVENAERTG